MVGSQQMLDEQRMHEQQSKEQGKILIWHWSYLKKY